MAEREIVANVFVHFLPRTGSTKTQRSMKTEENDSRKTSLFYYIFLDETKNPGVTHAGNNSDTVSFPLY